MHFHYFLFSTPEKEILFDAQSPSELKRKSDQRPEKQDPKTNKDSNDDDDGDNNSVDKNILTSVNTNIKHVSGNLNAEDLYALPNKRKAKKIGGNIDSNDHKVYEIASDEEDKDECDNKNLSDSIEDKDENKDLPFGWEKHEDNDGPYYWHIKSGTIQREPPLWPKEQLTQSTELKTPSSSLNQSPSLMHMQNVAKCNPNSQQHIYGINNRPQVCYICTSRSQRLCCKRSLSYQTSGNEQTIPIARRLIV